MTNDNQAPQGATGYYGSSLLAYLKDSHPDRAADTTFIEARADAAAQLYCDTVQAGRTHTEAEELAAAQMYAGLHFSPYNTLVNILWDEFSAEVPEDSARAVALKVLPLCGSVLVKYNLTDDFAETPDYELLYTELVGTVQILLEDGTV